MRKNEMKSVNQHSFAQVPAANIQRSTFNRSSNYKTTFDSGLLIPVFRDEALPGDTFNLRMSTFARLATPIHPVLDNLHLDSHFFSVPIRLIWDNWQKFNGEQIDPGDSTDFTIPEMVSPGGAANMNSTSDYLGIPISATNLTHSSLFHRAINLIWNEWFRDQNLQDSVVVDRDDGPDTYTDYNQLHRRGKRHDYFTSCLPWPLKGDALPVILSGPAPVIPTTVGEPRFTSATAASDVGLVLEQTGTNASYTSAPIPTSAENAEWFTTGLEVSAFGFQGNTINELRQAFQIQKLYERDARGGSRYTEIVRSHFGVVSPDARLQRPEYLGGGTQQINITPVPATSEHGTTPIGELGGYGVSTGSNHSFTKSFTEHCIIIGFVSVRADLNYQQGLERCFSRSTRWDFYLPALAHLGEQAVLNKEIFAQGTDDLVADAAVFGYQERWAEYRYKPSLITGAFRSTGLTPLDTWHLAQEFTALPTLGETFIEDNPPVERIVAVDTEPDFLFDAHFALKCTRPMPTFSVPGQIDRF